MSGIFHRAIAYAAAIWLLTDSSAGFADAGSGHYRSHGDVLRALKAPPLEQIGTDVVRFSSTPALGGLGFVIELHRRDANWATGTLTLLVGAPSKRWETTATITLEMRTEKFQALTKEIDAQLLLGEPPLEDDNGDIVICTDGPGYAAERLAHGLSIWLTGFCRKHPNNRIVELLAPIAAGSFERWLPKVLRRRQEP